MSYDSFGTLKHSVVEMTLQFAAFVVSIASFVTSFSIPEHSRVASEDCFTIPVLIDPLAQDDRFVEVGFCASI